ncbi:MAG: hypothetical protein ACM3NQ_18530 [Bacteroidales bacterium]
MLRRLNRYFNIVREVNLDAIRREAEASVPLLVVADLEADRAALASLLNGNAEGANPWLHAAASSEVGAALALNAARLALLVSRGRALSDSLESARALLAAWRIPVVTLVVGSSGLLGSFARGAEKKRVVVSSLSDDQRDTIADALFDTVGGDARLALARQFEGLRGRAFETLINETARANASYAFTTGLAESVPLLDVPLNVGDIVVLTKNQLIMAYRIALAAGKEGRPRDVIGELIGVMGGGLLARQVARELIGLVPVLGVLPKVAVAYTGTWAIGHAAAAWATGRGEMTRESFERLYAAGRQRGREVARQLASRRAPAA